MAEDLDNAIRDNATGPAKASGDGTSMEQHSLAEQIAADKYLSSKKAVDRPGFGLRKIKIIPPGTV